MRSVSSREDHPDQTVRQFHFVEVDDQTQRNVQQLHVAKKLSLMNGQNLLNTFEFQQKAVFRQYIKSEWFVENQTLVLDSDNALIHSANPAQLQLAHKAPFIDTLNQTRPLEPMDLNGSTDSLAAQLISLLEKRMHRLFVHKANKGNEEIL